MLAAVLPISRLMLSFSSSVSTKTSSHSSRFSSGSSQTPSASLYQFISHPSHSFLSSHDLLLLLIKHLSNVSQILLTVPFHCRPQKHSHLVHHRSHACVSSLSVLPAHGLHVLQGPAGPAAASLPQPGEEPQQGDGLVLLHHPSQENQWSHTSRSYNQPACVFHCISTEQCFRYLKKLKYCQKRELWNCPKWLKISLLFLIFFSCWICSRSVSITMSVQICSKQTHMHTNT